MQINIYIEFSLQIQVFVENKQNFMVNFKNSMAQVLEIAEDENNTTKYNEKNCVKIVSI